MRNPKYGVEVWSDKADMLFMTIYKSEAIWLANFMSRQLQGYTKVYERDTGKTIAEYKNGGKYPSNPQVVVK